MSVCGVLCDVVIRTQTAVRVACWAILKEQQMAGVCHEDPGNGIFQKKRKAFLGNLRNFIAFVTFGGRIRASCRDLITGSRNLAQTLKVICVNTRRAEQRQTRKNRWQARLFLTNAMVATTLVTTLFEDERRPSCVERRRPLRSAGPGFHSKLMLCCCDGRWPREA